LTRVLGHDAIPAPAQTAIAAWLTSGFYRLSEATRQTATESLVESAGADDSKIAEPALTVLIRLGDLQMLNLKPLLNPSRQRKIVENYRALRQQNKVPQSPEFESQLTLR
jgi:hypothetical protein